MADRQFNEVSFYVVAHADDWQLFMNPNAYYDMLNEKNKVVIIITTAGDAGKKDLYWQAREEGCKSSVRYCLAPHFIIKERCGTRSMNSHKISFWEANNVYCYFLRLPDGNLDGSGFPNTFHFSLSKLKSHSIISMPALDQSALYRDWEDFYFTLNELIIYESQGLSKIYINYLDPDVTHQDHADHTATGCAVQAMDFFGKTEHVIFSGYECNSPKPISSFDLFWKVGMLAAYEKAVFDKSGYSTLKEGIPQYLEWCLRRSSFKKLYFM